MTKEQGWEERFRDYYEQGFHSLKQIVSFEIDKAREEGWKKAFSDFREDMTFYNANTYSQALQDCIEVLEKDEYFKNCDGCNCDALVKAKDLIKSLSGKDTNVR